MIAVDTSALMAMVLNEPEAGACRAIVSQRPGFVISAVALAEALIVAQRRDLAEEMAEVLETIAAETMPATSQIAHYVSDAYSRWGRGVHPARLNLIDCFSYVAAQANGCPLLYVGDDFAQTDVASALPAADL